MQSIGLGLLAAAGLVGLFSFPGNALAGPTVAEGGIESFAVSDIDVREGRLWVDVRDMPADELFEQVGEAAGFEVRIDRAYSEKHLTVRFSRVEVERAVSRLVRLLDTKNFRLSYGGDGTIARLDIFKPELSVAAVKKAGAGRRTTSGAEIRKPARGRTAATRAPRRTPVRRRVRPAASYDFAESGNEEGFDLEDEFADEEQEFLEDEFLPEDEDAEFLVPAGEVQRFR